MPNYAYGKIYKIFNTITDDFYIGSTTQMLCQRMRKHRHNSKYIDYQTIPLYKSFHEHGIDNFYIELIEQYDCCNKEELTAKEGHYIRELNPSLNKVIIGRTKQEYRKDNEEKYKIQQQQYRNNNKDVIRERHKIYRENNTDKLKDTRKAYQELNKDTINERSKLYYEQNKDNIKDKVKQYKIENKEAISEKKKERVVCERCGLTIRKDDLARHYRSNRCQAHFTSIC